MHKLHSLLFSDPINHLKMPSLGTFEEPNTAKRSSCSVSDHESLEILPGLPDDVAKHCVALVPRTDLPSMAAVSRKWRWVLSSREFIVTRKLAGSVEEWIYVNLSKDNMWEVFDRLGNKQRQPPPMPTSVKLVSFGKVVVDGKLLVVGGYSLVNGVRLASADVFQYDSCLNSWSRLASMNVARFDFACTELNGTIYAVGGYGIGGEGLSVAEFYNPKTNKWTDIENLRRPRWGCFGYSYQNKLYVISGRSNYSIGHIKSADIYDIETKKWCEIKNGCAMVTSHAVIGDKLYCLQWNKERKLAIYDPEGSSWVTVPIPLTGSSSVEFRFGVLDRKLLLFSQKQNSWYSTLVYDPEVKKWGTSRIKPSGFCVCSVTIES